ncbi:MAG: DUF3419 family protein [Geminicoccaceae bacterium]
MANELVRSAALQAGPASKRGVLERMFAKMFEGLVYAQIWEDPEVDMEAMELGPKHRIVTIASGGCNVMSYLTADPAHVIAVDLNPAHIALLKLKILAAKRLPDHARFLRFFGDARGRDNLEVYDGYLEPALDEESRAFWNKRGPGGRRRISMFRRNVYKHGLLGRTIQMGHVVFKLHGLEPERIVDATDLEQQRAIFAREIAPVFETKLVKKMAHMPALYFGLGIPPAQFDALTSDADGDIVSVIRSRIERLACDFPIHENWFAWQAFARRYPQHGRALPPYLRAENFEAIRTRADRIDVHQTNFTDQLCKLDAASVDRYILLDAQDWMNRTQLTALWSQITRTARPGARVIFRTAAEESQLPDMLPADLLARWTYDALRSQELHAKDRSAIYGGFHLYHFAS